MSHPVAMMLQMSAIGDEHEQVSETIRPFNHRDTRRRVHTTGRGPSRSDTPVVAGLRHPRWVLPIRLSSLQEVITQRTGDDTVHRPNTIQGDT